MKQLTNNILKVVFPNQDVGLFEKVEFAFSQEVGSTPLKLCTYPSDTVIKLTDNSIGVIWTAEETNLFESDEPFYMDTRISYTDSEYQPSTPIVKLKMNPTLFERGVE